MTDKAQKKQRDRARRHARVRKTVTGTAERPRLAVYRSNKHITAQIIDDVRGHTLATATSLEAGLREGAGNVDSAARVGELVAKRAQDAGVKRVVFDRGGFRYAGRVAALAGAAREAGLEF